MLVRAARQLSGKVKYTILIMSDSVNHQLLDEFKKYGDVVFLKDLVKINLTKYAIVRTIIPLREKRIRSLFVDIDLIHASCSFSVVLMRRISRILNNGVLESGGVYHSREYLWGDKTSLMRKKQLAIFNELPVNNVLFMNEYTTRLYSSVFAVNYTIALPIGVDTIKYLESKPDFTSCRIISIGRLVDFKTYNRHMITSLHSLNNRTERNFIFEIYGDGPELESLKCLAKSLNVKVNFYGKIEYESMPSILNGAFAFVGSGTAILEAAAAGIPSIVGVESIDSPLSHGFITQTTGLSFHEKGLDCKKIPYNEVISQLVSISLEEYENLSLNHRIRAEHFSLKNMELVLTGFYQGLNQIQNKKQNVGVAYSFSTALWLLKNILGFSKERKTMYDFK